MLRGMGWVRGKKVDLRSNPSHHKLPVRIFLSPQGGWRFLAKGRTKTKNKSLFSWQGCVRERQACCLLLAKGLMPGQPRSLRSQGIAVAMAWAFILQTVWFPVWGCVLKGKRETKEKFGAVSIYNEASPSLPSKTLFCPFYRNGKVKIFIVDSRVVGDER